MALPRGYNAHFPGPPALEAYLFEQNRQLQERMRQEAEAAAYYGRHRPGALYPDVSAPAPDPARLRRRRLLLMRPR